MKKVFTSLVFAGVLLTSCNPVKTELAQFQSNKTIVQKEFPNYHITSFRQFNYIFQITNPEHIIKVTLNNAKIIKKDTLKVFSVVSSR